jgi:RNA polymerase sigma factor (TIGR02999 family)
MNDGPRGDITRILLQLQESGAEPRVVVDRLFEATHAELRRVAAELMRAERPGHTLRPTALVHDAYIRLVDASKIDWQSRAHFFGIAARAMRQILVDHARHRLAGKREGGWQRVTLEPALALSAPSEIDILQVDAILTRLTRLDDRMARVVELRVFGGMKIEEVAHVLGVSPRTVRSEWRVAKMWFTRALEEGPS